MEFTGKTVEEAVNEGLKTLGIEKEDAVITVISEEVKGFFGKVKSPAVVNIESKLTGGQRAVKFLEDIFEKIGAEAKANLVSEDENIQINIVTTSTASVIGYRGEVLDALQSLAGAVANIGNKNYVRVVVNCEGYREKREETLIALAKKIAEKAIRQGRDISLEPMNPFERRVIHSALADYEGVTTASEGKEPNRYVVVIPNEKKEYKKDYKGGKGGKSYGKGRRPQGSSSTAREPKKRPTTFGTYLGNSLKKD